MGWDVCSVKYCTNNTKNSGKTFFSIPKDERRRRLWCETSNLDFRLVTNRSVVCSDHFKKDQLKICGKRKRLLPNAVPQIQQDENRSYSSNVPQPDSSVPQPLTRMENGQEEKSSNRPPLRVINGQQWNSRQGKPSCSSVTSNIHEKMKNKRQELSLQLTSNVSESSLPNLNKHNKLIRNPDSTSGNSQILRNQNFVEEEWNLRQEKPSCSSVTSVIHKKMEHRRQELSPQVQLASTMEVLNDQSETNLKYERTPCSSVTNNNVYQPGSPVPQPLLKKGQDQSNQHKERKGPTSPTSRHHCQAKLCKNVKEKCPTKSFFKFPKQDDMLKKWCAAIGIESDVVKKGGFICSDHFKMDNMTITKSGRRRLLRNAIPKLNLGNVEVTVEQPCNAGNTQPSPVNQQRTNLISSKIKKRNTMMARTIKSLRQKHRRLKTKISGLKIIPQDKIDDILVSTFGDTSLSLLIREQWSRATNRLNKRYNESEKISALTLLYSFRPAGYTKLQKLLGLSLPSLRTLRRWLEKLDVSPGLNERILLCIKDRVGTMNNYEKDAVLMWDEMSIKTLMSYDKNRDEFEGLVDHGKNYRRLELASEVLVILLRGINTNWVFPLAYYFSKDSTTTERLDIILNEAIKSIQEVGLRIRVGVCDQGFCNQGLMRLWGVDESTPFIMRNEERIVIIHDICHIVKLVRTHIKKHGFFVHNEDVDSEDEVGGEYVNWKYLEMFYEIDSSTENRYAPKLRKHHFEIPDLSKMKVSLATQLLSHSVYSGITAMIQQKMLPKEAEGTAKFIKLCDEMFDFLNISKKEDETKPVKSAKNVFNNYHLIKKYQEWVNRWEMTDGAPLPPCVNGLKLTLAGIKLLIPQLKREGYKFILTRRFQQDCIEHYFGSQRSAIGCSRNPTCIQFRKSFRFLFVKSLLKCGGSNGNCENNEDTELLLESMETMESVLNAAVIPTNQMNNGLTNPDSMLHSPLDASSSSESDFEDDVGRESNDEDRTDSVVHDIFKLSQLSPLTSKDENIAVYLGNWAAKTIIKKTKCIECKRMLEYPIFREDPDFDLDETFLTCKAYGGDNFLYSHKELSYGHVLNETHKKIFKIVVTKFRPAVIYSMNSIGRSVLRNIKRYIKSDSEIIQWFNESNDACRFHRNDMLNLVIRSKIFLLVKIKNQSIVKSKSSKQTRRELRNQ